MNLNKIIKLIIGKLDLAEYIFMRVFVMIVGFMLNILLVKKVTTTNYGVYSLAITVLGFLVTFGFDWNSSSLMFFGVEEKIKYGSLNRTFWARNIILIPTYIIVGVFFFLFSFDINKYLTVPVAEYIFIWMTLKIFSNYLNSYFLSIEKRKFSIYIALTSKISMLLLLLLCKKLSLNQIFIYFIIAEGTSLIWIIKINKKDIGKFIFDKIIFKEVLFFGFWQLFGYSGLYFINFGDNLIIKYFLSVEDVGIYNIAYQLFMAMAGLSYLFANYFAPQMIKAIQKKNIEKLENIYKRDKIFLVILVSLPHILVILLAKKIIVEFYGINYVNAVFPLIILTFGSIIEYFSIFNMLIYNSFKKYKILQILNIFQALLNIIFDFLFIPKFGISGAAYGTVLSYIIIVCIKTYYANKIIQKFKKEIFG